MNTTLIEDNMKCSLFWWGVAVLSGLTLAVIIQVTGWGALPALVLGGGSAAAIGALTTRVWCRSAQDVAEDAAAAEFASERALAERAAAAEAMAAPRAAPAPRPLPQKAAPTVPSAPPPPAPKAAAPAPEAAPVVAAAPVEATAAAAEAGALRPAGLGAPRDGAADDLKKIKGIGQKAEAQLNALGIHHFDQIAGWSAAELAWIDENLEGFKGRATRDDWVAQAGKLASA